MAAPISFSTESATPVTILTGFLGSGKTTLVLNLIPQLPGSYKLALLKNELGNLAVDSQLAASASISSVRELLNGCICCNLVGQLSDALHELREERRPDPATLAMEVNRLAREANQFLLDGVIGVIDVENWRGYEDTSVTAKLQAKYTDLVIFNKWESAGERRFDDCLDRLADLEVETPWVKSQRGKVHADIILGIDGALAKRLEESSTGSREHGLQHRSSHHNEVDVLNVSLTTQAGSLAGIDLEKLEELLQSAPREEVYRMKAILYASSTPCSSDGEPAVSTEHTSSGGLTRYILNWAFGRWTFKVAELPSNGGSVAVAEQMLRMTIVVAQWEGSKWKKRLDSNGMITAEGGGTKGAKLQVDVLA